MSKSTYNAPLFCFRIFLTISLLLFALAGIAFAQAGTSTAADARTRYLAESGQIPSSREVAVEEIVNYRRHEIGLPKAGEAVAMDVRWGNNRAGTGQEAVLQIGLSTALANDREQLRPINLSVVIDKSGSMADADKLVRVKEALLNLVSKLRDTDTLSIVVFDSEAQVLMPARTLENKEVVKRLIRSIEPGSSTNLQAGLMLGYHEALKSYRRDATNRVILLTDGIANTGVTDPERIAHDSLLFNDRGIDLSTTGVGLDLNKDLLRELAKSGRGLFHFVADSEDINKVFVKEVQSLVAPVASEPNLEIDFPAGLELVKLYGYEPRMREDGLTIKLDNMNQGLTQVVLLRFRVTYRKHPFEHLPVNVRLTYYDLEQKRRVEKTEAAYIVVNNDDLPGDMLRDGEVRKNYSIAQLAQAIRDMAAAYEAGRYGEAERLLNAAINKVFERYPNLEDEDIGRTMSVAQKYRDVLRRYIQQIDP